MRSVCKPLELSHFPPELFHLLYTIGQLAKEYPEIKDALHAQLQMLDLEIPTKPHIMDGDRDEMSSIGSRPDQGLM